MTLILGDCVEVMAGLPAASVDAVVCDPPYGLGFMGKAWDSPGAFVERRARLAADGFDGIGGNHHPVDAADIARTRLSEGIKSQEWHHRWATEALRVAKPGAYLLAFGGTRTVHRLTCAIEDAGWIIRDCLVWAYASGFPKSRALLKPAWEPIVMARKPGPLRELAIDACRIGTDEIAAHGGGLVGDRTYGMGKGIPPIEAGTNPHLGRWPANVILTDPIFDGDTEGVVGGGDAGQAGVAVNRNLGGGSGGYGGWAAGRGEDVGYGDSGTYSRFFELPEGDGCYLCGRARSADASTSPGARPPGSAHTDAATSADGIPHSTGLGLWEPRTNGPGSTTDGTATKSSSDDAPSTSRTRPSPASRRAALSLSPDPANNAARLATSSGITTTTAGRWTCDTCADLAMRSFTDAPGFAERPDAPRVFLIPKADRAEREPVLPSGLELREAGVGDNRPSGSFGERLGQRADGSWRTAVHRRNTHPTVKPLDLMRHLVRLVTPTGGTVLDPFLGSGTTAIAAEMEGFEWVGIEREAEYVAIAEARLAGTQRGLGLDVDAPDTKRARSGRQGPDVWERRAPKFQGTYQPWWGATEEEEPA